MEETIKKIDYFLDNKFYYKILYLFVSLIFVTILKDIPKLKEILNTIVLAWGLILVIYMFIKGYRKRKIYKFDIPLGIFMIFTLILNLVVYRNIENIKVWVVNLILISTVFTIDVFKNRKNLIREMNSITYFYCIFMFLISIVSLFMRYKGIDIKIGDVIYGNTKGLFVNENALAIATSIALVLSIYLNSIAKEYKEKIFLSFNIIIQFITMIGSHGRSAYLILIAVIYISVFLALKNNYLRVGFLLMPIVVTGIFFETIKNHLEAFTTERNVIWRSAAVLINEKPFTGVGNKDLIESMKNAIIGGYLPGIDLGGLHNIYVQIATVNGLIALGLFIVFLIMIIVFLIGHLDKLPRKEKNHMAIITSVLVGILAVNLFESALVYTISFISIIFWIYLGYLISILDNKNID